MENGYRKSLNIRFHLDPRTKLLLLILFSVVVMIDVTDGPAYIVRAIMTYIPVVLVCPGRETPCRRKIYCSFHFGYMAYGDYTGKHRGHSGHVDSVSMLHDYAVCTNDDYGLVLYFNNKNQ